MTDWGPGTALQGKTIAIAGASKGIGKETALLLSSLGVNLVLGSRTAGGLEELAPCPAAQVLALELDVAREESVDRFMKAAAQRFGTVDAVINSAGTGKFASVLSLSAEDFDRMIAVNLRGTFLIGKYFGRHMAQNRAGKILNIISIAGTTALPGGGGYSASKFGALGLSRVMQAELRSQGVEVINVLPGAAATSFWDEIHPKPDAAKMIPVKSLAKHLVYLLCRQEGAFVDEIAIMPTLGIL